MKKLTLRLLAVILSVYLAGSVFPLLASSDHAPAPSAPAPPPPSTGGAPAPMLGGGSSGSGFGGPPSLGGGGCGGGGCGGGGPGLIAISQPPPESSDAQDQEIANIKKDADKRITSLRDKITNYKKLKASGTSTLSDDLIDRTIKDAEKQITKIKHETPDKINQVKAGKTTAATTTTVPDTPHTSADATKPEATAPTAPTAPTVTKKPETPTTPSKDPTRLEVLNKSWDFWQSQYASWENDRLAPADQCQKNMAEAAQKIADLKRDFAGIGKTPPTPDKTAPQYPPQTPKQQNAMNNYNNYLNAVNNLNQAQAGLNRIKQIIGLDALTLSVPPATAAARDKAERDVAAAQAKVDQLNAHWQNSGNQAKYGSLPNQKTTAPDPTHNPKDPRKPQRTVDPMEYKIKSTR